MPEKKAQSPWYLLKQTTGPEGSDAGHLHLQQHPSDTSEEALPVPPEDTSGVSDPSLRWEAMAQQF